MADPLPGATIVGRIKTVWSKGYWWIIPLAMVLLFAGLRVMTRGGSDRTLFYGLF